MKNAITCFCAVIMLLLCACSARETAAGPVAEAEETEYLQISTWQEQYDLGVRYLSEGNYEEAIIAFTAAIEIEPKRPDAYKMLAEAYYALGMDDEARNILQRGYEVTGDSHLKPEASADELTQDEIAMENDLLTNLANHDMERSREILASEEFLSLVLRIGTVNPDPNYPITYLTLGSPDNGAIVTYDARSSSAEITCMFGPWDKSIISSSGNSQYCPSGEFVYYYSRSTNFYLFSVVQLEDGLANGSCIRTEVNMIDGSGGEQNTFITTTSGMTVGGLWDGLVITRSQSSWAGGGGQDVTGETEFVNGVPTILGYTGTGSVKFVSYSRNQETGRLLGQSDAGAFYYCGNGINDPYRYIHHNFDGEGNPYEYAASNMRLYIHLPFVWEDQ